MTPAVYQLNVYKINIQHCKVGQLLTNYVSSLNSVSLVSQQFAWIWHSLCNVLLEDLHNWSCTVKILLNVFYDGVSKFHRNCFFFKYNLQIQEIQRNTRLPVIHTIMLLKTAMRFLNSTVLLVHNAQCVKRLWPLVWGVTVMCVKEMCSFC